MTQPHQPSRKQAVIFLILTVVLAAGIFAWVFFLNKGTLAVEGNFPLTVHLSSEEAICSASPCTITVKPGDYTATIKKEGYFDTTVSVTINRGETTTIHPGLTFIPALKELGDVVLPVDNAPLRPPFLGMSSFKSFPKNVKSSVFSASGNKVLIGIGKELFIYDMPAQSVTAVGLPEGTALAWVGEDLLYLDTAGTSQVLKKWDGKTGQTIVSFPRPFVTPQLFGALDGSTVLIQDGTDKNFSYYVVDVAAGSRKALTMTGLQNPVWTKDFIIFEMNGKDDAAATKVIAYNPKSGDSTELAAIDAGNVIEKDAKTFIFVTADDLDSKAFGTPITEAIDAAKKQSDAALSSGANTPADSAAIDKTTSPAPSTPTAPATKTVFISQFNTDEKTYATFAPVELAAGEKIERLTISTDGKGLYFVKGGKLFEVVLQPSS